MKVSTILIIAIIVVVCIAAIYLATKIDVSHCTSGFLEGSWRGASCR